MARSSRDEAALSNQKQGGAWSATATVAESAEDSWKLWRILAFVLLIVGAVTLLGILLDSHGNLAKTGAALENEVQDDVGDIVNMTEDEVKDVGEQVKDADILAIKTTLLSHRPSPHLPDSNTQQLPLTESRPALCSRLAASDAKRSALRCDCLLQAKRVDGLLCHLSHAPALSPAQLRSLASSPEATTSAWAHTKAILSFGTRVPGDEGWSRTLSYIRWVMDEQGWAVDTQDFEADTPRGKVKMQNVVATFNPSGGECALDVAAHLDSKQFPDFLFLGASDSAAPVGIMLAAAQHLTPALRQKLALEGEMPCLRFLFLDGEEAVGTWSKTDSLYGSRYMAWAWAKEGAQYGFGGAKLDSVRTLVLLDLLGCAGPTLHSRFKETLPLFERLQAVEGRLRDVQLIKGSGGAGRGRYFQDDPEGGVREISDDDVPFKEHGVPILHAISVPFPAVWHKASDTLANLDQPTVEDLALIFRASIAEVYALPVR